MKPRQGHLYIRHKDMMTRLISLTVCFFVTLSSHAWSQVGASPLILAEGSWELVPNDDPQSKELEKSRKCEVKPLRVEIDPDTKRYIGIFGDNEHVDKADILRVGDTFLTIKYDNEERKMDNGELQVWHMLFTSPDVFVWVRQDWVVDGKVKGATQARRRCTAPIA